MTLDMGYCNEHALVRCKQPDSKPQKKRPRRSGETFSPRTDSLLDSYIPEWDRASRLSRGRLRRGLSIPVRTLLALTVRILLLLSGLLTATLLLARLLSGFLVLLAGILVLI